MALNKIIGNTSSGYVRKWLKVKTPENAKYMRMYITNTPSTYTGFSEISFFNGTGVEHSKTGMTALANYTNGTYPLSMTINGIPASVSALSDAWCPYHQATLLDPNIGYYNLGGTKSIGYIAFDLLQDGWQGTGSHAITEFYIQFSNDDTAAVSDGLYSSKWYGVDLVLGDTSGANGFAATIVSGSVGPETAGVLRTKISDLQVGDYIACNYTASSGAAGTFSGLGGDIGSVLPVLGSATPNGTFFFIKVDRGLLIADRVIQHSVTWDVLNTGKYMQGLPKSFDDSVRINMTGADTAVASSNKDSTNDSFKVWNMFDASTTSYFNTASGSTLPVWVQYKFPSPTVVRAYKITPYNLTASGEFPATWEFQGSTDGVTWDILDVRKNAQGTAWSVSTFVCNQGAGAYQYYRLYVYLTNTANASLALKDMDLYATAGKIRSLTGGVNFADANGMYTTSNGGTAGGAYGAWPTNNEYDTYLVNSNLGGSIVAGDDAVWHGTGGNANGVFTWCQDTPTGVASTNRVQRAYYSANKGYWNWNGSGNVSAIYGCFRPVLEYNE